MLQKENERAILVSPSILFLGASACILYAMSAGIRSNYGILLDSIMRNSGIDYASVSFIVAVAQLVFGVMQPIFGIVALKKSNRFVLVCGAVFMVVGMFLIPYSRTFFALMLALGIILPAGTGAISFGIIMGAVTPRLGQKTAATISGLVNASSGVGSSLLSVLIRGLLNRQDLYGATRVLSILFFLLIPISLFLNNKKGNQALEESLEKDNRITHMFRDALGNKTFGLLMLGFFTCGFHMAIIETHLYSQFISLGTSDSFATFSFSAYGIATVLGAILSGLASSKFKMKNILAFLYGSRGVFILLFLLLPKNSLIIFLFALLLGFTSSATVTPTAGLVSQTFGSEKLGILFGFVFFCHQVGSFMSAWLGGVSVMVTGAYTLIWSINILLCLLASSASFAIKEY